jgi:hypothetical protein
MEVSTIRSEFGFDMFRVVKPDMPKPRIAGRSQMTAKPDPFTVRQPVFSHDRVGALLRPNRPNLFRVSVHTPYPLIDQLPRPFMTEGEKIGPRRRRVNVRDIPPIFVQYIDLTRRNVDPDDLR